MEQPIWRSIAVQNSGTRTVSTIGEDLTITGDVASKGEIHLDGHVQGDVNCGAIVLGENSSVEGSVAADEVVIRGRLIGSVRAFRLMLQSTSHIEGDLYSQESNHGARCLFRRQVASLGQSALRKSA